MLPWLTFKSKFDSALWDKRDGGGKDLRPWQSMVSGFFAVATGPLCTGPFDVVKDRFMAQGGAGEVKYKGTVHVLPPSMPRRACGALWRGVAAQALAWAVTDQVTTLHERIYLQPARL